MALDPLKGHAALRRGRVSRPGAEYFLTFCTDDRHPGLLGVAGAVLDEMHAMTHDGSWELRCATVMPDYVHLLIKLGDRLSLGQCIKRLKAKTSARLASVESTWERDFFDRQMRVGDDERAVFLYVYLNPYRAGLCQRHEKWPWYYCRPQDWIWFQTILDRDLPPPEWLM